MDDLLPLAKMIADCLKARGETIAVAESSTGGLISAALLAVPGASAYFRSGAVAYARQAKRLLLGLDGATLSQSHAGTQAHALLLARAKHAFNSPPHGDLLKPEWPDQAATDMATQRGTPVSRLRGQPS